LPSAAPELANDEDDTMIGHFGVGEDGCREYQGGKAVIYNAKHEKARFAVRGPKVRPGDASARPLPFKPAARGRFLPGVTR